MGTLLLIQSGSDRPTGVRFPALVQIHNILRLLTGQRRSTRRDFGYTRGYAMTPEEAEIESRGGQMPTAVTTISRLGRSVLTPCIRPLSPALDANESKERRHVARLLQHPLQMLLIFLSTLSVSVKRRRLRRTCPHQSAPSGAPFGQRSTSATLHTM